MSESFFAWAQLPWPLIMANAEREQAPQPLPPPDPEMQALLSSVTRKALAK